MGLRQRDAAATERLAEARQLVLDQLIGPALVPQAETDHDLSARCSVAGFSGAVDGLATALACWEYVFVASFQKHDATQFVDQAD